jgi:hypothetical protein
MLVHIQSTKQRPNESYKLQSFLKALAALPIITIESESGTHAVSEVIRNEIQVSHKQTLGHLMHSHVSNELSFFKVSTYDSRDLSLEIK